MKNIRTTILAVLMVLGLSAVPLQPVGAINVFKNCDSGPVCNETKAGSSQTNSLVRNVITTLLFVLGVIAVIMIVVGGIRYALSQGDPSSVASAKNTILYSVVGLVVALLSYAIVGFVMENF